MTQTTYIKKHKINVILPENKTIDDFNTDYDMWGGSLVDLKNEGYDFPELDKKEKRPEALSNLFQITTLLYHLSDTHPTRTA